MNDESRPRRGRRLLRTILVVLGVIGLLLALEGGLSLGSTFLDVYRHAQPLPEGHRYTAHDSILGWTAEAGLEEADAYGEWRPLTTDDSGLRTGSAPGGAEGAYRIVCGGGASVFGIGVADGDTWCSRLGASGPQLETVNAGQPAYGPGQAWMLLRDRVAVKHDLLLFTVDAMDMFRLLSRQDAGFPKPRVEPGESGLQVTNTPIPRSPYFWPWVTFNASLFSQAHLLAPFISVPPEEPVQAPPIAATVVMSGLVPALQELAASRDAGLVVAFLPSHPSLEARAEPWRRNLAGELELRGVPFIDLAQARDPALQGQATELFGREAQPTAMAHQQVADALLDALGGLDDIGFPRVSGGPWRARYFNDAVFQNLAGVRQHAVSSLDWGTGSPLPGVPNDGFSVVLDACLPLDRARRYRVRLEADGPATFSVNRQTVLDTGEDEGTLSRVNAVDLPAGGNRLRIRYRDSAERAFVRLMFESEDGRVFIPGPGVVKPPGAADCGNQAEQGGQEGAGG